MAETASITPSMPAQASPGPRRRFRWGRWLAALVALVAVFGLVGFYVVPPIAKKKAEEILSEQLLRPVTVGGVELNPYTLALRVTDVVVGEKGGGKPLFSFAALDLDAEWLSLFKRGIVVRSVTLEKPAVSLVRMADGRLSIADIVEKFTSQPKSEGTPPRFAIHNIRLVDGRVDIDDRMEGARHALTDLQLGVPFVSSFPADVEVEVEPHLKATLNGDPIALDGETTPFAADLDTTLKVRFEKFHFARYLEYVPMTLAFKVPSGALTAAIDVVFRRGTGGAANTLLLRGAASVSDLAIVDRADAPLVAFRELGVKLKEIDLGAMKGTIEEVVLAEPVVNAKRDRSGAINLLALAPSPAPAQEAAKPEPAKEGPKPAAPAAPFALVVDRIAIEKGTVAWLDETTTRPFATKLSPLDVEVKKFNLPGDTPAEVRVDAKTDLGATIAQSGTFTLAPVSASGEAALTTIHAKALSPYYESALPVEIADGVLDAKAKYEVKEAAGAIGLSLADVRIDGRDLKFLDLADRHERAFLQKVNVVVSSVDTLKRSAVVESVVQNGGRMYVRRAKDGSINWAQSVTTAAVAEAATAPQKPAARKSATKAEAPPAAAPQPAQPAAPDWSWVLKSVNVDNLAVRFEDRALATPVSLDLGPTTLALENLASTAGSTSRLSVKTTLDKTGAIAVSGPVTLAPLGGALALDLKSIPIVPFQPYFAEFVNVVVGSGTVSMRGNAGFAAARDAAPIGAFQGDLTIADLDLADKATAERLLRWKSLLLSQLKVGTESKVVDIGDIALTDFFARLVLSSEGRLNLQDLVVARPDEQAKPDDKAKPAAQGPASAATTPDIRFSRITLQNGNVNFSDFFIKPNYSANLTDITGGVTEITPEKAGDVLLRGRVDKSAPLEIAGQVNPLAKDLFLDIRADARDIDLPSLTPYAAKYAGYGIEKGKLSFKVAYKVAERKLNAENSIVLDQLTFGERIESPTATRLPVLLAVALLKDRNGVIDINLPITGSLDDPQFSVGGIIWRALLNLITRAVTAPFSLIAAAFGSHGEELSYVEFDPGEDRLGAAAENRLKTIAKALGDRPALKLDVAGRVDPAPDTEALRAARVRAQVRALKAIELTKKGTPPASVDAVTVTPEEYPRYLDAVFREAKFEKPPKANDLPVAEKERLLRENTRITDEELRELANRRALAAKAFLLGAEIPGERVFIVAPKLSGEDLRDKGAATRADFSLK